MGGQQQKKEEELIRLQEVNNDMIADVETLTHTNFEKSLVWMEKRDQLRAQNHEKTQDQKAESQMSRER